MHTLHGQVAIVTGASSGVGEGIARMLAGEGVKVALAARWAGELERVAQAIQRANGTALIVPTDVAVDADLHTLVTHTQHELGPIDILVNSAGVAVTQPIHALDLQQWDMAMAINLRAPALLCAAVLPGMRERKRGWIINVASEAGMFVYAGYGAYAVSKHALRVLTELIQQENQEFGVKAWAVCPGMVDTPMGARMPGGNIQNFLSVEDIVEVVRFLLHQRDNVKMGPDILIRTMHNPFGP